MNFIIDKHSFLECNYHYSIFDYFLYYIKYRLIVQLRSGVNIINYKDIANEVNRSPTSIRKWCSKITELSEYTFNFEEIYQGRTRAPIKKPNFTKQEAKE